MSAFEDALRAGPPEPDMSFLLPAKLGGGDKGGAAAKAAPAGGTARPSETQGSATTGPEPSPQLPEGSDPDEPDAPEENLEDLAALAREMFSAPEPSATETFVETEPTNAPAPEIASETASASLDSEQAAPAVPKKGGGLAFEGESAYLKQFPRALIDQMRQILAVQVNDEFARDISQVSIVSAFVMASMGSQIGTDEVTAHAVKAFRASDPRTDAIDKRTATLLEQQTKFEGMLKALLGRLGDVKETAAVLEMGQAYALAERTAQLDTSGTVPENIDVAQKRVLAARDNIRSRVKKQLQDEKIQAGRPIR